MIKEILHNKLYLIDDLPGCPFGTVFTRSLSGSWMNQQISEETPIEKQYTFTNEEIIQNLGSTLIMMGMTKEDIIQELKGKYFVSEMLFIIIRDNLPRNQWRIY